jgi:hypothetical protein
MMERKPTREPDDRLPPMNIAFEECLARAGYDDEARLAVTLAWIRLGFEYYARNFGRESAIGLAQHTARWAREARPVEEWPP